MKKHMTGPPIHEQTQYLMRVSFGGYKKIGLKGLENDSLETFGPCGINSYPYNSP
jgi:hypothetical protein